jgi:predicted component of type VI protein secretion system
VILTRENTIPDNKTITSKEQAELSFKDGRWTIVDKSEQHTTFVLATREIELQNGDIVMLGNQLFRFNDGNAK